MKTHPKIPSILAILLLAVGLTSLPDQSHAGVISKPLIWLGEQLAKKGIKAATKQAAKEIAEKETGYVVRHFGEQTVRALGTEAAKHSMASERLISEVARHPSLYKQLPLGAAASVAAFNARAGQAGRYVSANPKLYASLERAGGLKPCPENQAVARESWRIARANGGSWSVFRTTLTTAENAGTLKPPFSRDYAEDLFQATVKAKGLYDTTGRQVLPKGTGLISGHTLTRTGAPGRHGIDFIHLEKDRPATLIEFGSGRKPSSLGELSDSRLRDRLATLIDQSPDKAGLCARGLPQELLDTNRVRNDPHFPIHDFVSVLLCAPDIGDTSAAKHATKIPIIPVQLH